MIRRTLLLLTLTLLAACEVVDLPTPTAAPASSNTTTPSDDSWYRLYFTNPSDKDDKDNRPEESIDDYVVASIASAARTVDAATYEFDLPSMAGALIDAHNRGLVVRLVTDTDSMEEEEVRRLIEAGVEVVDDQRSAIMHDKFVIVDGLVVWTGSWNFTENDTYRNNNNVIGIASPEMVANYQTEFNEMFERREFGPTSSASTPYPQFTASGVLIENYFAPEDEVTPKIVETLNTAAESIYFAAFAFTSDFISNTMVERAQAGVKVQGVYETRQVNAGSDDSYRILSSAELPVLLDGNRYTMHHKFIVVDGKIVITGSFNFSGAANEKNDENILILHSPEIAAQYLQEFQRVWQKAGGN
ncbi:MAG TPA: phospholipase D-like domain-containing protein [Anaerolineales bacterium]|nr:phospholipase D-like domain-containing protein [Anaerolineales bacterium]